MAASTSVHSNAFNFMSCLKSGVDPRTGLYNISISMPELQSNDLRGPGFRLDLSYSQLNTLDSGYGMGWNLQVSQYNPATQILSLSTGETFLVDGTGSNGLRTMTEKKIDTFHFYKQDDTSYRVVHKSGLVEILELHISGNKRMAWAVKIIAPSGHSITLKHKLFKSSTYMLASITDDLGQTLLEIARSDDFVELKLHPYEGIGGAPLARFLMTLVGTDRRVSRITLPTENNASWRFEYTLENDHQWCVKHVETPSGSSEDVYYEDEGHAFPYSAGRPPLPRVTKHVIDPGLGQAKVDVRYTYKDGQQHSRNFLGAELRIVWEDDGLDNLYKTLQDYNYVCTESLWVDSKAVRSIERTFNRFHLQTLEVTTQNNNQQTVATAYNILPGERYSMQPNNCQLPSEVTTRWQRLDEPERTRTETVTYTYDLYGNPLVHTRADGIQEVSSWYPAGGGDGCPADAEGFVSRLKEKVVEPAPSSQSGAPTLSTRYRYSTLPALTGSELPDWIVPETETLLQLESGGTSVELQKILLEHINQPDAPFQHGRIAKNIESVNGKDTVTVYEYSHASISHSDSNSTNSSSRKKKGKGKIRIKIKGKGKDRIKIKIKIKGNNKGNSKGNRKGNSKHLQVPVQLIEITTIGFDNTRISKQQQQSLLTGQVLLILEEGVEIRYVYDALNRLTKETIAPNSSAGYEASREYEYTLCSDTGQCAEQVLTDARKVKIRSVMDGLGRVILEERDHIDSNDPQAMCMIHKTQYNAWNNVQYETDYDWFDNQQLFAMRNTYTYDDWNQQSVIASDHGMQTHQYHDPIGSKEHNGPVQKTWVQSGDAEPLISGRSETWLNMFGKPDKIKSQDAAGRDLGSQTFLYDGIGRCTEQTDASDHKTQFSYDAWSRMVSTRLPDSSEAHREYEPFSTTELPTSLNVIHPDGITKTAAGKQTFDGLGRLTLAQAGQRIEHYEYEDGHRQIKTRKTAKGDDISYTYNLALTDQIVSSVSSTAPDDAARFEYDNVSARLISATNKQGKRTYAYDAHNQLTKETWEDLQGRTWQTLHRTSLQGRAMYRTDVEQKDVKNPVKGVVKGRSKGGVKNSVKGVETIYRYDTFGRLESAVQGNVEVTTRYDTLGQPCEMTTHDTVAGTSLVNRIEYDDQGQEVLRTQNAGNHPVRTLTQQWQPDGLMQSRHLQEAGNPLLLEEFQYDARGRLSGVAYSGSNRPVHASGKAIINQRFIFDELDNMTLTTTRFDDVSNEACFSTETAIFRYGKEGDPDSRDRCQLLGITYLPPRDTPPPTFSYDANGNQSADEHGNLLYYDSESRLVRTDKPTGEPINTYAYDSNDHLATTRNGSDSEILRFYQGQQLSSTVQDDRRTQFLHIDEQPIGQQTIGEPAETLLLLTDANQSVIGEFQQDTLRTAVYSAYGERHSDDALLSVAGFNGEVCEKDTGWYLLGNGYRAYNPGMMRFHSPDSLSPFGAGGVNPYTYCLGNPIAWRDPTGHDASSQSGRLRRPDEDAIPAEMRGDLGLWTWVSLAAGVVFTLLSYYATVTTFGIATPVTAPIAFLGLSMTSYAGASITTAVLATGTFISAASTAASTYGAVTGNTKAMQAGQYLGYIGAAVEISGGILRHTLKRAVHAAVHVGDDVTKPVLTGRLFRFLNRSKSTSEDGAAPTNPANSGAGNLAENTLIPRAVGKSKPVPPRPNPRPMTGPYARRDQQLVTNEASPSSPSWLARSTAFTKQLGKLGQNVYMLIYEIRR
ncbi:RHS repeat-associated core domain-containing protein [Pseudomonas syringae group sp. 243L2]|uniref:RHS repeat-associated core domain-containing protein n=1 Tax=Pseudomonas syringae group sp. 243L2 TaxID=3079593 RepID=UPI00291146C7|nr:RHS repeat-associated core domain-containing protein [Pseudomonas syringae group sp. 243L2]MDU8628085.1 RHS repeat-associated core domain-containing protein [Pseudomonas syringae group sp. 243L2]